MPLCTGTIPIILLAAGQSRRMRGGDKLLETVDAMPLLRRQALLALPFGPVIVMLPPNADRRAQALKGLDLRCVEVTDAAEGLAASIRAGIREIGFPTSGRTAQPASGKPGPPASGKSILPASGGMLLLADLPDLMPADLSALMDAARQVPADVWRGATQTRAPGHPVIIASTLFPEMSRIEGDDGGRNVLRRAVNHLVPLTGNRARRDLDTPEEWASWRHENPHR